MFSYTVQCWYKPDYSVQFLLHRSMLIQAGLVFSICYTVQSWYKPDCSVQFLLHRSMLIQAGLQCSVLVIPFNVDTSRITTLNVQFLSHCSVCIHFTLQCSVLVAMFNVDQCSPQWNVQCSDCVTLFSIDAVRIHCSLFSSCFSMLIYSCCILQWWHRPHYHVQCSVLVLMLSDHIVMFCVEFLPDCSIWIQATLQCSVLVAVFSIDTGNITVFSSCCSALIAATLQCSVLVYIVQYG